MSGLNLRPSGAAVIRALDIFADAIIRGAGQLGRAVIRQSFGRSRDAIEWQRQLRL